MSITSLSSQYISASFNTLVQYSGSGNIYDGTGTQINNLNIPNNLNVGVGNSMPSSLSGAVGRSNEIAAGASGFASGKYLIVSGSSQTVVGAYNKQNDSTSPFIVGLGSSPAAIDRADVFKVTQSGSIVMPTLQTGGFKPSYTGQDGEIKIVHDGGNPYIFIFLAVINDWKGIKLEA
jgi:hypothetical protein